MHTVLEENKKLDDNFAELHAEFPAGPGPFPALILAPGLRYDMHRPIIAQVASHLLSQGFAVFRFNWTFYTANAAHGQPSAGLTLELQDLKSVVNVVKNDERVQQQSISVAGKSFGSIVVWRVFRQDTELKSCILLTPLCAPDTSGEDELSLVKENYPDAMLENRRILMLAGNADPHCELATLHQFAADTLAKFNILVLDGNHSLEIPDEDASVAASKFDRNLHLLATHIQDFLLE
ncbi:alpha/beta family hydrolase [Undibacterium sp. Ji42W]|uniref:alpha/beta family hydrolase n=1 Tax=Undibacterium sp. Ji42W TaxID=3413039 RepID=UPI003BF36255